MPYWRLHYHLVWATRERVPLLSAALEHETHCAILDKARELGVIVHGIGNVEDHVHVAVSIPPKLAVADCVKHLKGGSSYRVNHRRDVSEHLEWHDGYGALTFGDSAMKAVVAYVLNQKEHHRQGTVRPSLERITAEDDGVRIVIE